MTEQRELQQLFDNDRAAALLAARNAAKTELVRKAYGLAVAPSTFTLTLLKAGPLELATQIPLPAWCTPGLQLILIFVVFWFVFGTKAKAIAARLREWTCGQS